MKNIPQNWFPVILLLFLTTKGYTQLNAVTIGDAQSIGNNCYVITENVGWQSGGVWYDNPIDFNEDFTIYYKNNFGNNDSNGADGMALVFKTTSTPDVGDSGGGVGYEGIQNSLIVEFDTWQNTDRNDPFYDHLSIMINGNASHSSPNNLVGPVPPTSTSNNMEDGLDHNVKIIWAASTQTFEVFFDCELRLTLNRDIKGTIFGGDSTVFFGFVGSTGGSSNLHQVCFNSISFVDNLVLQPQTICIGESAQVDAEIPSGNTYTWSPSTGVSDVNIPNPTLSPNTTTTYTVTIEDECGEATIESVEITVTPQNTTTFDPIDPICEGDSNPLPTTDINGVTGNWTPAFDATTTTDYSFTPDPGQCATTPAPVQVVVNPIITTTFDPIDPICEGDSNPLPTTDINGVTGSWTPAFDATATTDYSFTPDPGQCATTPAPVQVVVNSIVTPAFDSIDPICAGDS
ncbi:MAG: L-type lectin-domain containing protein, partial [Flavobacteriaceae bacterium]